MLETLREYASERLRVRSGAPEVQQRHAQFYANALTRWWGPAWWGETPEGRAVRIGTEYENIESSLRWLVAHDDVAAAQRLAGSLTYFWILRGRVEEGRQWLTTVLGMRHPHDQYSAARAQAVTGLMQLETEGGNRAEALASVESDLSNIRKFAEPATLAQALMGLGWLTWVMRHDAVSARVYLQEGLNIAGTARIGALEALGRARLAVIANAVGDYAYAETLIQRNRVFRLAGGEPLLRYVHNLQESAALLLQGDYAGAEALAAEFASDYDPDRHPFEFVRYMMLLSRSQRRGAGGYGGVERRTRESRAVPFAWPPWLAPGNSGADCCRRRRPCARTSPRGCRGGIPRARRDSGVSQRAGPIGAQSRGIEGCARSAGERHSRGHGSLAQHRGCYR
jgi:hypothetical protein